MKTIPLATVSCLATIFLAGVCQGQPLGGYKAVPVSNKEVVAAAKFAVEAHSKKEKVSLAKILKAESQVVAGRNFRITMDVRSEGRVRQAVATVWAKLDGTRELTEWEWTTDAPPKK
jgi:hypothetical protein